MYGIAFECIFIKNLWNLINEAGWWFAFFWICVLFFLFSFQSREMHRLKRFHSDIFTARTYTKWASNSRSLKTKPKKSCCLLFCCFLCLMLEHTMLINFQSLTDVSGVFIKCYLLFVLCSIRLCSTIFFGDENRSWNTFHRLKCSWGSVVARARCKNYTIFIAHPFSLVVIYFTACRLVVEHQFK